MSARVFCYVGRAKCGHVTMVAVDDGSTSNASEVARVVRNGGTIDRVTVEDARQIPYERCPDCRPSLRAQQGDLFDSALRRRGG